MSNGYYVAWGVWDAEHRALGARVDGIEKGLAAQRDRVWLLTLGLVTGVVCPVIVTALIALAHLRA